MVKTQPQSFVFFCMLKWMFPKIVVPQTIHFNRVFHYKPSIMGYHCFWKHPYLSCQGINWNTRNTVDGRNPAPVDMVNIPLFTWFLHPRWCRISSINSKALLRLILEGTTNVILKPWIKIHLSYQKTPFLLSMSHTGCLIETLILVYSNPYITG